MDQPIQEIRMPDRAQRLYTVKDYELALERANGDQQKAVSQEEARGCGFAFMYMSMLHDLLERHESSERGRIFREINRLGFHMGGEEVADALNKEFDVIRQKNTVLLNMYIRSKGYIDAWPVPRFSKGIVAHGWYGQLATESVELLFDFFAPDFVSQKKDDKNTIIRDLDPILHKYESKLLPLEELAKLYEKEKRLERFFKPTKSERRWNNIKICIAPVPMLIAVFWALVMLAMHFLGLDSDAVLAPFNAVGSKNNIISFLILVPYLLTMIPAVFYPLFALHPAVFWGGIVILLVAGIGGWTYMLEMYYNPKWITKKQYFDGVKAQRKLDALRSSERYRQLQEEYKQSRIQDEALAYLWQTEWLEVCKEKYYPWLMK